MDCARAEELLSDHLEGALDEPLLGELERHLLGCNACRLLRGVLAEVVAALHALPLLDAPSGLAARAAAAALASARRPPLIVVPAAPSGRMPPWLQAVAAVLAIAITGGLTAAGRALGPPARLGSRLAERTANAGSYLVERKERLVEDVRLLRAVVETAFEERLDRVAERVDDYRRLLERRRALEQRGGQKKKKDGGSESSREFLNLNGAAPVQHCESGPGAAPSSASPARLSAERG